MKTHFARYNWKTGEWHHTSVDGYHLVKSWGDGRTAWEPVYQKPTWWQRRIIYPLFFWWLP